MTLTLELRAPTDPVTRARWCELWHGDGTPNAPAWEGLAGPPGAADGDSWPTRQGDRAHPAPPSTATVAADAMVQYLLTPRPSSDARVAALFAPGAVLEAGERDAHITPAGGARRRIHGRPARAGDVPTGAWVLWRSAPGAPWRPAKVGP